MDKSLPRMAIFLDLPKTFNVVNRTVLYDKLEKNGNSWKSLKSHCKVQVVKLKNCKSSPQKGITGIPQSTILSPFLSYGLC